MTRPHVATTALAAAALVAGCRVGPDYSPPAEPPAEPWLRADGVAAVEPVEAEWWTRFDDPQLDDLIARAAAANRDLAAAAARVHAARAIADLAGAERLPALDGVGTYSVERPSLDAPFAPPGTREASQDRFRLGFDSSWEIDLFGGLARASEAAAASAQAREEEWRAALLIVQSEVAREYFELRGAQEELAIARANLDVRADLAALTSELERGGLATAIEVARARAAAAESAAAIALPAARIETAIHRLATLVGARPAQLDAELAVARPLPALPARPAIGLSSELMRRRPDVRAAERALAAATARIGVDTADLYPRFTFRGSLVGDTTEAADLFHPDTLARSFGPGFSWHLLDAGRVRARIAEDEALRGEALARFEQALLTATEEVESALSRLRHDGARVAALATSTEENRAAVAAARERFARGLEDFLVVLDAEDARQRVETAWIATRTAQLTDCVALYKALGGGWEGVDVPPADARPARP